MQQHEITILTAQLTAEVYNKMGHTEEPDTSCFALMNDAIQEIVRVIREKEEEDL